MMECKLVVPKVAKRTVVVLRTVEQAVLVFGVPRSPRQGGRAAEPTVLVVLRVEHLVRFLPTL